MNIARVAWRSRAAGGRRRGRRAAPGPATLRAAPDRAGRAAAPPAWPRRGDRRGGDHGEHEDREALRSHERPSLPSASNLAAGWRWAMRIAARKYHRGAGLVTGPLARIARTARSSRHRPGTWVTVPGGDGRIKERADALESDRLLIAVRRSTPSIIAVKIALGCSGSSRLRSEKRARGGG